MSDSQEPKEETERGPEEVEARLPGGQPAGGIHEVPLFLRDKSVGRKGNARDDKDAVGE